MAPPQRRRILVTGGCGFIGSNFINYIHDRFPDDHVVNIDKLAPGAAESNVAERVRRSERYHFVKCTIQDMTIVDAILREHQIDTIVHFAAVTHVDESYAERVATIQENVVSTTALLESAVVRGYSGLKRFVHISTDEVYGDSHGEDEAKTEQSGLNPTNPYAASKAACEHVIRAYFHSYKLPYVMVRMNNVYGPRQAYSKVIPKFTRLALEGRSYPLMGDGKHTRSWMFVDDCAEAICRVLESGRLGEVYNIGTDFEMSNVELTRRIHALVQQVMQRPKSEPDFVSIPDRPYHDRRYHIHFGKILRELGWHTTTDFGEGLRRTVAYYVQLFKDEQSARPLG